MVCPCVLCVEIQKTSPLPIAAATSTRGFALPVGDGEVYEHQLRCKVKHEQQLLRCEFDSIIRSPALHHRLRARFVLVRNESQNRFIYAMYESKYLYCILHDCS